MTRYIADQSMQIAQYLNNMLETGEKPSIAVLHADVREIINPARPTENHGNGRPSLQRYIVARHCPDPKNPLLRKRAEKRGFPHSWDECNQKSINDARERFNRGEVELVTGRDGDWIILYAIPRKHKRTRSPEQILRVPRLVSERINPLLVKIPVNQ